MLGAANPFLVFLPLVLPVCLWVAWSDMARMKIPNRAVLTLLAIYLAAGALALPTDAFLRGLAVGGAALVIGFVVSSLGMVGAGDAKFAAAMAPFVAQGDWPPFLILFATVLIASFALQRTARAVPALRRAAPHWESWERSEFPAGIALAAALAIYLAMAALGSI